MALPLRITEVEMGRETQQVRLPFESGDTDLELPEDARRRCQELLVRLLHEVVEAERKRRTENERQDPTDSPR